MKRQWLGAFVAGLATTAIVGAAQQNPVTPPADPAPPSIQRPAQAVPAPAAPAKADTVTISGCIQDAPMATAAARLPEPAGATKTYYLNNVVSAPGGKGPVGTTGLNAAGYRLEGDAKQISMHLNQQVRIVGVVQGSSTAGPLLKVESVTMVSPKCEPANASAKP